MLSNEWFSCMRTMTCLTNLRIAVGSTPMVSATIDFGLKVHAARFASIGSAACGVLQEPGAPSLLGAEASLMGAIDPSSPLALPPVADPPLVEVPPEPPSPCVCD